ncbi:uncharacterized protein PV09_05638 [Verruconis gallopava]|uniref:Uncharacterized protein n=1 Tax=Verruconis gallopava TaxID=253628 RepID=A0A0D1YQZ1_9PEZI|nr:uncharacterized protein PV09_05638 [Verruconis gallopava]KIW02977.1 hypothetical protein PV09_05638 [Verruconis gallopava]
MCNPSKSSAAIRCVLKRARWIRFAFGALCLPRRDDVRGNHPLSRFGKNFRGKRDRNRPQSKQASFPVTPGKRGFATQHGGKPTFVRVEGWHTSNSGKRRVNRVPNSVSRCGKTGLRRRGGRLRTDIVPGRARSLPEGWGQMADLTAIAKALRWRVQDPRANQSAVGGMARHYGVDSDVRCTTQTDSGIGKTGDGSVSPWHVVSRMLLRLVTFASSSTGQGADNEWQAGTNGRRREASETETTARYTSKGGARGSQDVLER